MRKNKIKLLAVSCAHRFSRRLQSIISIKFCTKLGKSSKKTLQMTGTVYGKAAMKMSSLFEGSKKDRKTSTVRKYTTIRRIHQIWHLVTFGFFRKRALQKTSSRIGQRQHKAYRSPKGVIVINLEMRN